MEAALLDTDILSEILKGKNAKIIARSDQYCAEHGRHSTTVITLVEVVRGFRKRGGESPIATLLLQSMEIFILDAEAAVLAGQLYADLEKRGKPLGWADPMIAAIAIRQRRTLVTGNTEHFQRIVDLGHLLKLEDWRH